MIGQLVFHSLQTQHDLCERWTQLHLIVSVVFDSLPIRQSISIIVFSIVVVIVMFA